MAIERLRINQQGVGNKHFKWYQVKEALTDPQAWMIVVYTLYVQMISLPITFSLTSVVSRTQASRHPEWWSHKVR